MNKIYSRLAFTNIKNNKTLYMPYIISGMVMIAMFYVMMFLNNSKGLGKVPGAEILVDIMGLGRSIWNVWEYLISTSCRSADCQNSPVGKWKRPYGIRKSWGYKSYSRFDLAGDLAWAGCTGY